MKEYQVISWDSVTKTSTTHTLEIVDGASVEVVCALIDHALEMDRLTLNNFKVLADMQTKGGHRCIIRHIPKTKVMLRETTTVDVLIPKVEVVL